MRRHETLVIVDFGSQVTQLIARRIREAGVYCEIVAPGEAPARLGCDEVKGLILSGGPASANTVRSPTSTGTVRTCPPSADRASNRVISCCSCRSHAVSSPDAPPPTIATRLYVGDTELIGRD